MTGCTSTYEESCDESCEQNGGTCKYGSCGAHAEWYCCPCEPVDIYCETFSTGAYSCHDHIPPPTATPTMKPTLPKDIEENECFTATDCKSCEATADYTCAETHTTCYGASGTNTVYHCEYCNCANVTVELVASGDCYIYYAECVIENTIKSNDDDSLIMDSTIILILVPFCAILLAMCVGVLCKSMRKKEYDDETKREKLLPEAQ